MISKKHILPLAVLISLAFSKQTNAGVFGGQENNQDCDGGIILHSKIDDENPVKLTKDDFPKDKKIYKLNQYVEFGRHEGTCCYKLIVNKNYKLDVMDSGDHEVKRVVKRVAMIDCVKTGNIVVPVVATSFAIILIATIVILLRRRYQHRKALSVPTEETS
eukprot:TRINITY_DN10149_c0_g2_i1.p1 TRINITY_DN10149_c0_g2~~TRINITY_DN10149_c0_g2_i1.p1  ORF type:complete len:161 (-),score=27.59 TRINITY_DN10149_c0_g2_i1:153-635(-)